MTAEENSGGSLDDVIESLNELAPDDFLSGIKSLPTETATRLKRLKGLASSQAKEIDNYLGPSSKKRTHLKVEKDGYIPLKDRLNAWWNGADIKISAERANKKNNSAIEVEEDLDPRRWSPASISIAQDLWGEGFIEPGGPAFAKKTLSPFKFESSKTVLDLSAGLGGTACILAKEHRLWLDAFEANEELAISGSQFVRRSGMPKKVPIEYRDFETLDLPTKKYHQIYSRESLFMVENKKNVIKQISKSLKNKGQVIITDYMRGENSDPAAIEKWLDSEPERPFPWTVELYKTALSHYGILVWSTNDISEEYLEQIHTGWLTMVEEINSGNFNREAINALMREGKIWQNRARAIKSGDLTVQRIHAVA